jgi:SPP1 gp7 family putative phage head morphogenesis protein
MTPKTAKAVHANRGVEAKYRRRMVSLIAEMHASVVYWLKAEYNRNPPCMAALIAKDAASPATIMKRALNKLGDRWRKKFDDYAPILAEAYAQGAWKTSDSAFRQALKDAGWAVEFKMTPSMLDAFNAHLADNVGLIRSIPEQYLQQVEGVVMRSYSAGVDLAGMVKDLKELYPAAAHRATLIARDQSSKANTAVNQARQLELGITEGIWMHSHAGKTPRPDHVAANGKKFKLAEGCLISGEYIMPGTEINCRCVWRAVLPI